MLMHARARSGSPVRWLLAAAAAAAYLALAGTVLRTIEVGGFTGGWAWDVGGLLPGAALPALILWRRRGSVVLAALIAAGCVIGGVALSRQAPYSAGRLQQVLQSVPMPAGKLARQTIDNNCLGNCPEINRYYIVEGDPEHVVAAYGDVLIRAGFVTDPTSDRHYPRYHRGHVGIGLSTPTDLNDILGSSDLRRGTALMRLDIS